LFSQGDSADSVFYLQSGRLKVTVVSASGKEATITLLSAGDFIGEDSLTGNAGHRSVTVTAITQSHAMKISRSEMVRVMHDEQAFTDLFLSHLLARSIRTQPWHMPWALGRPSSRPHTGTPRNCWTMGAECWCRSRAQPPSRQRQSHS
jgi:hypothetical protein